MFWVECGCRPPFPQSQFTLATAWCDEGNPCFLCGKPMRWYGRWAPPRQSGDAQPRPYEVLSVIRVNADDSPSGFSRWHDDGYFPVMIVCQNRERPDGYILWPRYWLAPDAEGKKRQYGQEAPQLRIDEWEYLVRKAREFLDRRAAQREGTSRATQGRTSEERSG
jgi:hypothetical protein